MSGFSFGTPTTTASNPISLPTFATPQSTPSTTNQFSFGATAAAPAGGFSFGTQPKPTTLGAVAITSAPAFVTPQPQAQISTQPAISATPKSTSFTFGTSTPFATNVNTTPIASTMPMATTSAPITLNTAPSTAQPNLFGTLNPATTSSAPITSLSQSILPPPTTNALNQQQQFVGLGGIDMSSTQQKAPENKMEAAKETFVPGQIVQSLEEFKTYVKNQKTISSEIARLSDRKLKTVTDEIQRMTCVLQEASNNIDNNRLAIRHLRNETAKVIENADMAQRTHETPTGLQFENVMPQIYFRDLIQKYETDLLNLKQQVELTEKHLQSLANPQNFTAQDLKRGLQQIYESFIALAGSLQDAHSKVETQKTQYLALRKSVLRDTTDVFETNESASGNNSSKAQYGPNAFSQDASKLPFLNMTFQKASQQQVPSNNFFGQPSSSFNFGLK